MKNVLIPVCIVFVLLALGSVVHAELYQWVDENGVVHMSDQPPPQTEKKSDVKVYQESSTPPSTKKYKGKKATRSKHKKSKARKKAEKKKLFPRARVKIYTTSWCGACKQALAFLREHGVRYSNYNVERSTSAAARLKELNPNGSVPVAVINGKVLVGFSAASYIAALETKPSR